MRGVAVGRKHHHGWKSLGGTRVAAIFYGLIESTKLTGVEPSTYTCEATRRVIELPGTIPLPRGLHE